MDLGLNEVFWALVYVISFFGSMSFGYLVLRFNIPDIRIVPREAKLGLSGIIGIIIFGLSMAMSYFITLNFLLFIPMWTLVFTALFMLQQTMFAKKEVSIAIPVAKMEKPPERPPVMVRVKPQASAPKVLEEREISTRGAFARESYPQPEREKMIVEKQAEQPVTRSEVVPEEEEKYIKTARERYKDRMEQRQAEEETRQKEEESRQEMARAEEEAQRVPEGRPIEQHREEISDRRRRYMERRGELMEEAKTDMFQASEKKEREHYEKELFDETSPAPEISLEELSKGLDVQDIEKIGSLDELGELGLGELGSIGGKELEELAGLSEAEKVPREKGLSCPKCHASNTSIVYCPYCGKGFCSNCSDKVQRKGDLIFYGCPSCKKDVIVKSEG